MGDERIIIFIDGSNFYHNLKTHHFPTIIDFKKFSNLQLLSVESGKGFGNCEKSLRERDENFLKQMGCLSQIHM